MAVFTNHKVPLTKLLEVIPEELFSSVASETGVDYYAKVLHGKTLFYLLLYALMMSDRLGRRGIADLYASPHFKMLFNMQLKHKNLSHGSLSERLSKVEPEYFKKPYEEILNRHSKLYPAPTIGGMKLRRVDSPLVSEASNRPEESLSWDNKKKGTNA